MKKAISLLSVALLAATFSMVSTVPAVAETDQEYVNWPWMLNRIPNLDTTGHSHGDHDHRGGGHNGHEFGRGGHGGHGGGGGQTPSSDFTFGG